MQTKLVKIGLLLIAAVLLIGIAFAGAASAEDITIASASDWQTKVAGKTITSNIVLTADIDLSGVANPMITILSGTFEGNHHSISNVTITDSSNQHVGLIGTYNGPGISNLTLKNFSVKSNPSGYVGGLIGKIEDVNQYCSPVINIINCHILDSNIVRINNNDGGIVYSGGLVGGIESMTENHIITFKECYATNCSVTCTNGGEVDYSGSGGILGTGNMHKMPYRLSFTDCRVIGSNITFSGISGAAGGIVGFMQFDQDNSQEKWFYTNCSVMNSSISSFATLRYGYAGGLIGWSDTESACVVKDCYIANNSILSCCGNEDSVWGGSGGLYGYAWGPKANTCRVENCSIVSLSQKDSSGSGGLVGAYITIPKLEKSTVKNCIITAYRHNVGGLVGSRLMLGSAQSNSISDDRVENCTIAGINYGDVNGNVGGLFGTGGSSSAFTTPQNMVNWSAIRGNTSVAYITGGSPTVSTSPYVDLNDVWLNNHSADKSTYPMVIIAKSTDPNKRGPEDENSFNEGVYAEPDNLPYGAQLITRLSGYGVGGKYAALAYVLPEYTIDNSTEHGTVLAYNATTPDTPITKAPMGYLIHVVAVNQSGYHFVEWNITNSTGKIPLENGNFTMPCTMVKANATFAGNVTTVNFHNDTAAETRLNTVGMEKNFSTVVITKPGYRFSHWNVSSTGEDLNSSTYVTSDGKWNYTGAHLGTLDVYANLTANQTTVDFYNMSQKQESKTYTFQQPVTMPDVPSRTGYQFVGWNVSNATGWDDFNSSKYNASGIWNYTGTANPLNVSANWTANQYTVTFHSNNGTAATSQQEFTYDKEQALDLNSFVYRGYSFANWSTNPAGTGTNYVDGASVKNLNATQGGNVDLYAQWKANTTKIALDQMAGTGSQSSVNATFNSSLLDAAITNPQRPGYTFVGWNVSADTELINLSGKLVSGVNGYTLENGKWDNTSAEVTVYANWTANTTTVTFYNLTAKHDTKSYSFGQAVEMPEAPTRIGHDFLGWNVSVGEGWEAFNSSKYNDGGTWNYTGSANLLNVSANWTANTYNITYIQPGHGTISGDANATYNSTVTVTATPADGFMFKELIVTENGTAQKVTSTGKTFKMPAFDVNVTAVFVPEKEEIIVSSDTISFGTVDLKTSSQGAEGLTRTLNVTNYLNDTVTLDFYPSDVFVSEPSIPASIPAYKNGTYTISLAPAYQKDSGDYFAVLTISNSSFSQSVNLSLSIVNTTEVRENTTIVPDLPQMDIKTNPDNTQNVTVDEKNTEVFKSEEGTTTVIIRNDTDPKVALVITNAINSTVSGKQEIQTTTDSEVTNVYTVVKADLLQPNNEKIDYQVTVSYGNTIPSQSPVTLTGDFIEDTAKTVSAAESTKSTVLSMVSAENDYPELLDTEIEGVSITFEIPKTAVTNADNLQAYHLKSDGSVVKITQSIDSTGTSHNVTVTDAGFSAYVVSELFPSSPYTPSHSKQTGSTVILQEGQVTPMPTPTPAGNTTILPTARPTQPTTNPTQKSPAPFVGILAGLGAALVLLRMRR